MKNIFLALVFIGYYSQIQGQNISQAMVYQGKLNRQFSNSKLSPLPKKEIWSFASLPFYAWDANFCVEATVDKTPNAPLFEMPTSTERKVLYQKYADLNFTLNGKKFKLSVYQNQQLKYRMETRNQLFLPFKDLSNGRDTYAGGRYIDLDILAIKNGKLLLDFNQSYNPYCAYNKNYSCPIPPIENHLETAIKAGIKKGVVRK
jgi:uncharacterized protein